MTVIEIHTDSVQSAGQVVQWSVDHENSWLVPDSTRRDFTPTRPRRETPSPYLTRHRISAFLGTGAGGVTASSLAMKSGYIKTATIEGWIIGPLGANAGGVVGTYIGRRLGGGAGAFVSGATGAFRGGYVGAIAGTFSSFEVFGGGILGTLLGAAVSLGVGAVCGVITGIGGGVFFGILRALASAVQSMFQ
jgi:hypothetical protein